MGLLTLFLSTYISCVSPRLCWPPITWMEAIALSSSIFIVHLAQITTSSSFTCAGSLPQCSILWPHSRLSSLISFTNSRIKTNAICTIFTTQSCNKQTMPGLSLKLWVFVSPLWWGNSFCTQFWYSKEFEAMELDLSNYPGTSAEVIRFYKSGELLQHLLESTQDGDLAQIRDALNGTFHVLGTEHHEILTSAILCERQRLPSVPASLKEPSDTIIPLNISALCTVLAGPHHLLSR